MRLALMSFALLRGARAFLRQQAPRRVLSSRNADGNSYEMNGRICKIGEVQTFDSGFNKREFVVRTTDDMYPQEIKFVSLPVLRIPATLGSSSARARAKTSFGAYV